MHPPPLEAHHLAAVRVPDHHLVLEVVLARDLGGLPELARAADHLPRQQQALTRPCDWSEYFT